MTCSMSVRSMPWLARTLPAARLRPGAVGHKTRTIANNESPEIIRMLNSEFDEFGNAALDLYPKELRSVIDETNSLVYDAINNGVCLCGSALTQSAYEESFHKLFTALDTLETRLGRQCCLVGDLFTAADLRLFPTLVRFDAVCYSLFKCNLRLLPDYHNLLNCIAAIKLGYYGAMRNLNPRGIMPPGLELDFSAPRDRGQYGKAA